MACEMPILPMKRDICMGLKPYPPRAGCVNQKTGVTERDDRERGSNMGYGFKERERRTCRVRKA
jgi:hypothetical protein